MASCHSVTIIEEKLSGDPMDVIMFVSTGWNLEEQSAESTNQVRLVQE
jgi:cation-transporting ATPase 13A3/4/5